MAKNEDGAPEVTGEAFGDWSSLPKEETDWLQDEPTETTEVTAEVQDAEPAAAETSAPAEGESQAEGTGETPPESQPSEPEKLYLGKYRTPEDLEAGYKNIQRQEAKARERAAALEDRSFQLEQALRQVAQHLMAQEATVPDAQGQQRVDPRMLQGLVDQRVQQQATQAQAQQLKVQVNSEVEAFRQAYPEVQDGTPLDDDMSQVIYEFQETEDGNLDHDLFPVNRDNLEIAYVLAKNPPLYQKVLEHDLKPSEDNLRLAAECLGNPRLDKIFLAEPHLLETEAGVELAKERASLPDIVATAQAAARPNAEAARRAAFVETGGTGAPVQGAPGNRPVDPMDEAVAAYQRHRNQSVF